MSDTKELAALLKALGESPKRDNAAYLAAMAEARQIYANAEAALGGPVKLKIKSKTKTKKNRYQVKWTFSRAD